MANHNYSMAFINAIDNRKKLSQVYSLWIEDLLKGPLWSFDVPDGKRIPWESAKDAAKSMEDIFNLPGLYIFVTESGVPRYIGITKQSLKERLFGRYVVGLKSQCQLAVEYEDSIREKGIEGFPKEIREWYRKSHKTSTVRLKGAVDFAESGITGIWFAVLPITEKHFIKPLEKQLIEVASKWNKDMSYPDLINKQHNK